MLVFNFLKLPLRYLHLLNSFLTLFLHVLVISFKYYFLLTSIHTFKLHVVQNFLLDPSYRTRVQNLLAITAFLHLGVDAALTEEYVAALALNRFHDYPMADQALKVADNVLIETAKVHVFANV